MKFIRTVLAAVVAIAAAAITAPVTRASHPAATGCTPSIPTSGSSTAAAVQGSNSFGLNLFSRLPGGKNTFISPASLAIALDMAYDGASGGTRSAMAKVLGLSTNQEAVRRSVAGFLKALQSADPNVGLTVANSLWARKGVPFRSSFLHNAQTSYAAKVATLDFSSPSAPETINKWVGCVTSGKIPKIVDQIPSDVWMYLINAVYLKGSWTTPFNPASTKNGPFTTAAGQQVQVPVMTQSASLGYYADPDFQEVSLPYGKGRFSMVVILPQNGLSAAKLRSRLNSATWRTWTSRLKMEHGSLSLPRFSFRSSYGLKPLLSRMGMSTAFSDVADFSKMCVNPCRITDVRHKTYVSVDEKGTTAAAATSVSIGPTAVAGNSFTVVVNRPFLVAIRDATTGGILFIGMVTNPS